ncbi:MAG: replication-associated recombination protein A [Candidatus Moranbacteria bacterium]|nr:replication-associated recombination protein A [Candidatus Moranbacteria bacterium]
MKNNQENFSPLASRMRPKKLSEFFGQDQLVGDGAYLRRAIENDNVFSMIFWGPPGTGKTTLASIIAEETNSDFIEMSAVDSGVKRLREIVDVAEKNKQAGKRTILFIDEIHRWNKAQQDRLLPHVERGGIILIGATTENPSFEVNSALLSRARVFVLKNLSVGDIAKMLERALESEKGLKKEKIKIEKKDLERIADLSNGDARIALNALEICTSIGKKITKEIILEVFQKTNLVYDRNGDEHFNIISALHKSMRGGDASAAVYWTVRMLEGGEDPIYIARRFVRFASEDIGLANNTALLLANSVFEACQKLGMPECGVHLAHCAIYLAKSPKSVAAYDAYTQAQADVKKHGNLDVPLHIRNAPTKLMKDLGYGKGYKYTPKEDSADQEYFPDELKGRTYM